MRQIDPTDRLGLIEIAAAFPMPAIQRACLTGQVEVLGGFSSVPPGTSPGWIVRFTTMHGLQIVVAVVPLAPPRNMQLVFLDQVPWKNWIGDTTTTEDFSIYRGDRPKEYTNLKGSIHGEV